MNLFFIFTVIAGAIVGLFPQQLAAQSEKLDKRSSKSYHIDVQHTGVDPQILNAPPKSFFRHSLDGLVGSTCMDLEK